MITRRAFIGTLTGSLLAAPLAADAQQLGRVAKFARTYEEASNHVL